MSYFRPCKYCGDNLDPGERCSCRQDPKPEKKEPVKIIYQERKKRHAG